MRSSKTYLRSEKRFASILLIALAVRLVPAALIFGTEDVAAWHRCAEIMASGGNPYDVPLLISWPPMWPVCTWIALIASEATKWPFYFVVKLFPIGADLLLTALLLLESREAAFAYALNPISIYVSAIHGNFDAIPTLFLTAAAMFASRQSLDRRGTTAGVWLGLGAAFKTWPLLMVPAFGRRTAMIAAAIFAFALLLSWPLIGTNAIFSIARYRGLRGFWGIPSIEFLTGMALPDRWIFYVAMIAVALFVMWQRVPIFDGVLLLLLTFYVTTPGFGLQYLLWVVPIGLVADRRRCIIYSTLAAVIIFGELLLRPYTGHYFDSLRFLPHADFARNYGGVVDQKYTSLGRLVLWAWFGWWWRSRVITATR